MGLHQPVCQRQRSRGHRHQDLFVPQPPRCVDWDTVAVAGGGMPLPPMVEMAARIPSRLALTELMAAMPPPSHCFGALILEQRMEPATLFWEKSGLGPVSGFVLRGSCSRGNRLQRRTPLTHRKTLIWFGTSTRSQCPAGLVNGGADHLCATAWLEPV